MARYRLLTAFAFAVSASAAVAQFELPDLKVYARAEDRARARLRGVPCTEADVGRGCYQIGERLVRESPCLTYRDGVIYGLATAKCVKTTRPQRFRGIWVDHFEGQAFIPAGSTPPQWPDGKLPRPSGARSTSVPAPPRSGSTWIPRRYHRTGIAVSNGQQSTSSAARPAI